MRKSLPLLAAALALLSGNAEGQAVSSTFSPLCVMGSFRPCASVIVTTEWDAVNQVTMVSMLVRNEQGSIDFDNTGGSFLTSIALTAPTMEGFDGLAVSTTADVGGDPVGVVGSPGSLWGFKNGGLGGQVEVKAVTGPGKQGGILGCDDALGATADFFITCSDPGNPERGGYTGWVVFSFTTTNQWSADNPKLAIALKFESIHGDYIEGIEGEGEIEDLSLICRTGGEWGDEHACAVVPEPSTWALLLTGMVGVLGMGWLRRKEEDTAWLP